MQMGLRGKRVLITGASKGIGFAAAEAFAREGCAVDLVARSHVDLEAARERLKQYNVSICLYGLDLAIPANVDRLAGDCAGVDILVNNAGAVPTGPIEEMTDAKWRQGFDLKIHATVNLTREIYLQMKARRAGVIVNVIGNCGERPDPEIIIGTIANSGLMAFTRALGAASPAHNVRVVGVNPGPTATERLVMLMQKKSTDRTGDAGRWEELTRPLPFGRAARPDEVADMIAFAASERASFVSGTILTVDGGVAYRGHLF